MSKLAPSRALDDTQPVPAIRLVQEDELTAVEWLDLQAWKAGMLWMAKWPDGRDW
jgi:hypothetical protein